MPNVRLYAAFTSPLADERLYRNALLLLPAERRAAAERLRLQKDRALSAGAGLLLRHALHIEGLDGVGILRQERKKPRLEGDPLFFNLSHAGELVLCAISEEEVGCDTEPIRKADEKLIRRFFHPREQELVFSCTAEKERDRMFTRIWTLKESYIKFTGQGLETPLAAFCTVPGTPGSVWRGEKKEPCALYEFFGLTGYAVSVCSAKAPAPEKITLCEIPELFAE